MKLVSNVQAVLASRQYRRHALADHPSGLDHAPPAHRRAEGRRPAPAPTWCGSRSASRTRPTSSPIWSRRWRTDASQPTARSSCGVDSAAWPVTRVGNERPHDFGRAEWFRSRVVADCMRHARWQWSAPASPSPDAAAQATSGAIAQQRHNAERGLQWSPSAARAHRVRRTATAAQRPRDIDRDAAAPRQRSHKPTCDGRTAPSAYSRRNSATAAYRRSSRAASGMKPPSISGQVL